jgi:hypothetical protein
VREVRYGSEIVTSLFIAVQNWTRSEHAWRGSVPSWAGWTFTSPIKGEAAFGVETTLMS